MQEDAGADETARADAGPLSGAEVALSGGGVRALLYGLGALRAVVAGVERGARLTALAGVSGGGIGAAYAAGRLDLATATTASYDAEVLRPAFQTITQRSLMWGTWHLWAVLAGVLLLVTSGAAFALGWIEPWPVVPAALAVVLVLLVLAVFPRPRERLIGIVVILPAAGAALAICRMDLHAGVRLAVVAVAMALAVVVFGWRGAAIERGMRAALFPTNPPLTAVQGRTRLVLIATDLGSGEATYLTPGGVISWRWGRASARSIPLVRAARATATFPGAFPALHLGGLRFEHGRGPAPKRLALVDGGVYDNMGTEWYLRQGPERARRDVYTVVVNASRNLAPRTGGFGTFGIGELRVLAREQGIQYDVATAPRRRWLLSLFKRGTPPGTIVRIDKNICTWVEQFAPADTGDARAVRARAMLARLRGVADPGVWERWATANPSVPTSLDRVSPATAADLVRAGYLATAVQLHILAGWPEPESVDAAGLFPWMTP